MFKVYDRIHGWFVCYGSNDVAIYTEEEAKMCVKIGVMFNNQTGEMNRRWAKKDFEIIPC